MPFEEIRKRAARIEIDLARDALFDELGMKRLKESYMLEEEKSPQERYAFVSAAFGSDAGHSQRLYDYASKHWLSYSTPVLSFGKAKKGLPISCFLSFMQDSAKGLVDTLSEVNNLSMLGGGVGIHVGIRSADDKSVGVMPHLKVYDASSMAYRQGKTRRGSYAPYLNLDHPDILMFLEMRKATGDQNFKCLNLHHGVNVPDKFMRIIEACMEDAHADDTWELRDPKTRAVVDIISAKELWERLLELRMQTGEPYLWFIDNVNKALPEFQKALGLENHGSNICCEISLATAEDRTAVCCLSSVNLRYFDIWKGDPQFLYDIAEMLDNVLNYFIANAPEAIERARFAAMRERAIGVGVLGFHTYLQEHSVPFESALAKSANLRIFSHIKTHLDEANWRLGESRGSCPDAIEGGGKEPRRFSHTMAIAPTASTSIIMQNISPSIEPMRANAFRQDTMSGAFLNKNRVLDKIILANCDSDKTLDYEDIWGSIISNDGSVQQLQFLTDWEKDVFKTAMEIDQRWVIEFAADRQKYIDQAQSLNLFFPPDTGRKFLHNIHFSAWKKGLKSLYYCRSTSIRKADKVSQKIKREKIEEANTSDDCLACSS